MKKFILDRAKRSLDVARACVSFDRCGHPRGAGNVAGNHRFGSGAGRAHRCCFAR